MKLWNPRDVTHSITVKIQ